MSIKNTSGWRSIRRSKPETGVCVLVYELDDRNLYTAWWDGKRWWSWGPDADNGDGDRVLSFKPTWWRGMPDGPPSSKEPA